MPIKAARGGSPSRREGKARSKLHDVRFLGD